MPTAIPETIQQFQINLSDAAAERPLLAIEAARIFSRWANVEHLLETMASVLLGDLTAMFLLDQLKSRNQKLSGIETAVENKISHPETKALLKQLFKLINSAADGRNELAHCLWGTIDQLPNDLLLINPKAALKATRLLTQTNGKKLTEAPDKENISFSHSADTSYDAAVEIIETIRKGTRVWRHEDFDKPLRLLNFSLTALTQYTIAISDDPEALGPSQARAHLAKLLSDAAELN
ncbi:hypothetical protein DXM27_05000 [Rhizobium rhizogenes]|uniref:Uncharacterized protein n=1 Tax=Rhizobium rhizogenes TaxID=359 RepID=A0AA88F313_RHIRH|nr:hypothetical protein [Rhizobium rhizogenes]KAA3504575.1 hypothetical protein DXM27_05000 [Rhizobium rhizogenes]